MVVLKLIDINNSIIVESSFFRDPLMELCIASRTKITTIDKYLTRLVFKEIIPYVGITNFEKVFIIHKNLIFF